MLQNKDALVISDVIGSGVGCNGVPIGSEAGDNESLEVELHVPFDHTLEFVYFNVKEIAGWQGNALLEDDHSLGLECLLELLAEIIEVFVVNIREGPVPKDQVVGILELELMKWLVVELGLWTLRSLVSFLKLLDHLAGSIMKVNQLEPLE